MKRALLAAVLLFLFASCHEDTKTPGDVSEKGPAAPGASTVTSGDELLALSWTAVSDATAYEIWYSTGDDSSGATKSGDDITGTSGQISGLTNDTTYYIWLKAKNSSGTSSFGTMASGKPVLTAAAIPGAMTVTSGDGSLALSWQAAQSARTYELLYNTVENSTSAAVVEVSGTSYTLSSLTRNITYYLWLRSKNSLGTSALGPEASGIPAIAGSKITCTVGSKNFVIVHVPGGVEFPIGGLDLTRATVADAYWIGETEVTYALWNAVRTWAASHGYTIANFGRQGGDLNFGPDPIGDDSHPVTTVSWRDAIVWCNALTEYYNATYGTSLACVYCTSTAYTTPIRTSTGSSTISTSAGTQDNPCVNPNAKGFRLLTLNEWELAARWRGSDTINVVPNFEGIQFTQGDSASGAATYATDASWAPNGYVYGQAENDRVANYLYFWSGAGWVYKTELPRTSSVKSLAKNTLGLYDMSGNVWEWCFEWYTNNETRSRRGGSWGDQADYIVVSFYYGDAPSDAQANKGFRIGKSQ